MRAAPMLVLSATFLWSGCPSEQAADDDDAVDVYLAMEGRWIGPATDSDGHDAELRIEFLRHATVSEEAGLAMYRYADLGTACPTRWHRLDEDPPTYRFTEIDEGDPNPCENGEVEIAHPRAGQVLISSVDKALANDFPDLLDWDCIAALDPRPPIELPAVDVDDEIYRTFLERAEEIDALNRK